MSRGSLRALIEEHRLEVRRLTDLQIRRMADMQAELDMIKATLRRAAPILQPIAAPQNGNGHRVTTIRP